VTAASRRTALLGLDVGTSAVKVGLYTLDGGSQRSHRVPLKVRSPRPGNLELDANEVWDAVVAATRSVLLDVEGLCVAAIGVAAAAPTPLLADGDGRAMSPVCTFADARAADDVTAFAARIDDGYQGLTGNPVATSTCSLLTGERLAEQVDADRPLRFGHLATLVVHRLTGQWVMDPTNAAYTGGLAISEPDTWSATALEQLGASSLTLPELVPSSTAVGTLTAEASRALGLPTSVVVATGCADTAAAAMAVGCLENGDAFESVGTSGVLTVCRDAPLPAMHAMHRPHVVPGRWLSHGAMSSSGAAVSWLREQVLHADSSGSSLERINQVAESALPGCGGVVFLPYLAGERSPVWDPAARGAWVGMTLHTTMAHLTRSVFEAAAYGLRQLLDLECSASGHVIDEFVSVGGGTNSPFWSSLKADVTGCVVHRAGNGEVAGRGAALLAACAAGMYDDPLTAARAAPAVPTERVEPSATPAARATYDQIYSVYTRLYPALEQFFPLLNSVAGRETDPLLNYGATETTANKYEGDPCVETTY
jgi:xylulokinase